MKMTETMIRECAQAALDAGEFFAYYQPQFNHATGMINGAEALIRWNHPIHGMQSPADFIPVLEEAGLIMALDLFVFEQVCALQARCLAAGDPVVPISFNASRQDLFNDRFIGEMERIRKAYDVPVRLLRVEITESFAAASNAHIAAVVDQLHQYDYVVEMDDFGSGYSSLNALKDIDFDIIKLDMAFLKGSIGGRGGSILSSVVYMCKWLNTPLIAEGVETLEIADYLKSIGCDNVQGYLYSRPLPEEDYLLLLRSNRITEVKSDVHLIDNLDAGKFWDPNSLQTLIFSNYVGGAAIIQYGINGLNVIRINPQYIREIGMNISEQEIIRNDPWRYFDAHNRVIFEAMLDRAIKSGEEEYCETWRTYVSPCCGEEQICIRSSVRVLGNFNGQFIFHVMIRNVTVEKRHELQLLQDDRRYRAAFEHAQVYAWEYTIATHEMRPCFRCMRDLKLPPLVRNYPQSAISSGIFPPEVADDYRAMMKKIDEGIGTIEAIFPLTVGRIPFHVRYTTEFDENGRPTKAIGSATLVVDSNV